MENFYDEKFGMGEEYFVFGGEGVEKGGFANKEVRAGVETNLILLVFVKFSFFDLNAC